MSLGAFFSAMEIIPLLVLSYQAWRGSHHGPLRRPEGLRRESPTGSVGAAPEAAPPSAAGAARRTPASCAREAGILEDGCPLPITAAAGGRCEP